MVSQTPFSLLFAPNFKDHLKVVESKYLSLIRTTIDEQLRFEPLVETRNRKPLARPTTIGATWELRFGPDNRFRVLYSVNVKSRDVLVLAIGVKDRNRLLFAGKELKL